MSARRRHTHGSGFESNQKDTSSQIQQPNGHYNSTSQNNTVKPPPAIKKEMSCRDRTNEFLSAVKILQSRQGNGALHSNHRAIRERSEFTESARKIGKYLANTFVKLEKLTILAKRKSIFDDKPMEIQELTYIIKQDINDLNSQIARLQNISKSQRGQNGRHVQSHSNSVVVALQSKLATMSNEFKTVLEVRTENLKQQKSRREQFSESTAVTPYTRGTQGNSILLQDEATNSGQISINMDNTERDRYQQQLQLIDEQDTYIQSRADTMQNIEQTIVELGGIFHQLAHMVKEQEEMVHRIDSNVDDAHLNVEAAHGELLKYFQSVTSNRWLMIKIFGVLIVFFIIFVVFMA